MKDKHYLSPLLEPKSVGVIGASERESSLGNVIVGRHAERRLPRPPVRGEPEHE